MNVAFFLTPKSETITLQNTYTLREAMDVMKAHRYTSVPVIDHKGKYIRTISEGDLLWYIDEQDHKSMNTLGLHSLKKVRTHFPIQAVSINANIEQLVKLVSEQSFVPVVDDGKTFIGIVKRSDVLSHFMGAHDHEIKVS